MKNSAKLLVSFLAVVLTGSIVPAFSLPAIAAEVQNPVTKSEKIINYDLETVWAAAIRTLGQKGILIQTIDKTSGIISTDEYSYVSGGSGTNKVLDEYVYLPSIMFASWSRGVAKFNLYITAIDANKTKVNLTPHFTACNVQTANYVSFCEWYETPSKGLLETKLLQEIEVDAVDIAKNGGPQVNASTTPVQGSDVVSRLERLGKLRDSNVLTQEEFQLQKEKILAEQ